MTKKIQNKLLSEKRITTLEVLMQDTRSDLKTAITELKAEISALRSEINFLRNNDLKEFNQCLSDVEKKLMSRPSWLVSSIFAIMGSIIVGLIVYIITSL